MGDGKEKTMNNYETIFCPDRVRIGVRSSGASLYWKNCPGKMQAFVAITAEDTLKVAPGIPLWNNDPLKRVKKKVRVPKIQLKQENEDEEKFQ